MTKGHAVRRDGADVGTHLVRRRKCSDDDASVRPAVSFFFPFIRRFPPPWKSLLLSRRFFFFLGPTDAVKGKSLEEKKQHTKVKKKGAVALVYE